MVYLKYIRKNNTIEYSNGDKDSFSIEHDSNGFYTTLFSRPFHYLGIDKMILQQKILGYMDPVGGRFPYCKTKTDVFKLLRGLQKESKIKYYIENEL